jgi:hypothetical protein
MVAIVQTLAQVRQPNNATAAVLGLPPMTPLQEGHRQHELGHTPRDENDASGGNSVTTR